MALRTRLSVIAAFAVILAPFSAHAQDPAPQKDTAAKNADSAATTETVDMSLLTGFYEIVPGRGLTITLQKDQRSDMATFAEMNAVWDTWVAQGHTPARATIEAKLAALREAMRRIWESPETAAAMGARASHRFAAHFTADRMVRAYAGLYQCLIRAHHRESELPRAA